MRCICRQSSFRSKWAKWFPTTSNPFCSGPSKLFFNTLCHLLRPHRLLQYWYLVRVDCRIMAYLLTMQGFYGILAHRNLCYTISWVRQESEHSVELKSAAGILAASSSFDERELPGNYVKSSSQKAASGDRFTRPPPIPLTLNASQLFSENHSFRRKLNSLWVQNEECADEIVWIRAEVNLTDLGSKTDSLLTEALATTVSAGRIFIGLIDV